MMESDDDNMAFIHLIEKYPVLLKKSQTPAVRAGKASALEDVSDQYAALTGKAIDPKRCILILIYCANPFLRSIMRIFHSSY
jgi:hypothetical protein